ncbi:hypothetical protein PTKIN_Ptkin10aG0070900 [Pterospermum kingtungense]
MDSTTLMAMRGRYAWLCVEVDLSKPLISKFRLRRKVRRIEYEAMHVVCFNCGKYRHRKEGRIRDRDFPLRKLCDNAVKENQGSRFSIFNELFGEGNPELDSNVIPQQEESVMGMESCRDNGDAFNEVKGSDKI